MAQTQDQIITVATRLFAERGFYGVSLANIADDLNLTKQALIHHFGTKEKLYGAVLQRISERFMKSVQRAGDTAGAPEDRLRTFFDRFLAHALAHPGDTRLILRELLDNRHRAEQVEKWYLKPFLEVLISNVRETRKWADAPDAQALAVAYQFFGSISYFAVSQPTLSSMFSEEFYLQLKEQYVREFTKVLCLTFENSADTN